ncbi:MAG: isoleucine--tRNA ligase [Flavobacteriales bacterium]|nr:isoleucine--tRNA ligase [Flavobacteriales bacterium]
MSNKYPEYKGLNLPNVAKMVLEKWQKESIFEQSIETREGKPSFVFFEGPPSANGLPGIHHVMARSIKDIFCRYKTLKGFQVKRKAGWDTHGLPVELGVEKELGITKEDIGTKISVDEYNDACRKAVMRYTDIWNDLTEKMGYWVDMNDPYITYEPKYMESVWWLLKQMNDKNLLYKGYTIQPYSPKAGTGLSSHELNQPGCYRDVKDTTVVAMFKIADLKLANCELLKQFAINNPQSAIHLLAWTTTPWTLPSNTALTVGPNIEYALVSTFNQYTHEPINVILAKKLISYQFGKGFQAVENSDDLQNYKSGDKIIPYFVVDSCLGSDLVGIQYEQLLPYALPAENPEKAFVVIPGDFVTTEDGTGIVHTAPTFGADDARVAKEAGVPAMLIKDEHDNLVPLVNLQGRFRPEVKDDLFGFANEYVKAEYLNDDEKVADLNLQREQLKAIIPDLKNYMSVDERIALKLKIEGKAFKIEKYEHNYPHCWRTDKPILYYPLDSWFIRVTDKKDRMVELNNTINWKPESTGSGRFGKWLENANDWNLSRSRYWGIPIPIWSTEDGDERLCIGSVEELKNEADKAVAAGLMANNPLADFEVGNMSKENYAKIDLHKHLVDQIILVSSTGKPMKREADLIDVWFDSGAMPYAQWHYPFENKELIENRTGYPADFIAEGVDQTRGWFYTLHAISTMVFDSVAYKNVVSNGLVLDKNGQKMSKRLGNAIDPFTTLEKYGPDATRWYMITNAQPWDNLKFDLEGITEVQRKFFGTLYNTYSFFSLYANIDGFNFSEAEIALEERPEIDRWVLSKLHSLIQEVDTAYAEFEPTKAGRAIQDFVTEQLSNWFVRLCRRRYWKSDDPKDKLCAYQTLYTCLETVSILAAPIAPFYMDQLFQDLNAVTGKHKVSSVHLADFPIANPNWIDATLEAQMELAQQACSLVFGLRKKHNIRVRQPLQKIMIPVLNQSVADNLKHVQDLILSEVNVKELDLLTDGAGGMLVKSIKPNFKTIGPKYGKQMKAIAVVVAGFSQDDITAIETNKGWKGELEGLEIALDLTDFEITAQDIPGWLVASENGLTVALDITISDSLKSEGIAREIVNRIQNLRKDSGLDVTDRIVLSIETSAFVQAATASNKDYICAEVLANDIHFTTVNADAFVTDIESEGDTKIELVKV